MSEELPDPGPLRWEAPRPASVITRRRVDLAATVVIEVLGVVVLFVLGRHWTAITGDAFPSAAGWMTAVQAGLVAMSGVVAAVLFRAGKWSFWAPLTAAALGTIGFLVTVFLLVASLPCPSFC